MNSVDAEAAIVVGVGHEGRLSEGTITFVVETAEQLDLGIELVHVVPTMVGGPTGTWEVGITFDQLIAEGQARLDEVLGRMRARVGGKLPVAAKLLRGGVIASLIDASRYAQLVVLERRHLSRLARLTEGSITAGVAARAHAPVVSVPHGWHPPREPRPITVAIEDAKRADAELWTALGLAAASSLPVEVVRVVYLAKAYQETLRRQVDVDDLVRQARTELIRDAQLPAKVCERVPCTFTVRWGKPAEVLVEASAASSLLVVGRRDPRLPFGSHLGPVVRQLLRDSECPVMVVEPTLPRTILTDDAGSTEVRTLATAATF
jgi:nucleotide-binding universal stress UspA family protein